MDETEIDIATHLADALKGFFQDEDDEDPELTATIDDVQVSLEEGHATLDWTLNVEGDEDDEDEEEGE